MGGANTYSTCHVLCWLGLSPKVRLTDPILDPQHWGLDPQGPISLKNNSWKGHSEDKIDSKIGSKQLQERVCGLEQTWALNSALKPTRLLHIVSFDSKWKY